MSSQLTNYQCPSCTGPLHFDSESGMLQCDYCGSRYSVDEIEKLYQDKLPTPRREKRARKTR